MFCFKCGQEVPDKSEFCFKCGQNLLLLQQIDEKKQVDTTSESENEESEKKAKKKEEKKAAPPKEKKEAPLKEKKAKKKPKPEKKPVSPWVAAFCSVFVTIFSLIVGFIYGISNDLTGTMTNLPNTIPNLQIGTNGEAENVLEITTDSGASEQHHISDEIYGDLLETIVSVAQKGFLYDYESIGLPQTLPLFQDHVERLAYAYFDVNQDGTSELFIGLEGELGSIMVFTAVDDEIFLISAVEEQFGSTLTSNGTFYHWGADNSFEFTMSESTFSHIDTQTNIPIFDEIETYMALSWLNLPLDQWGWYLIPAEYGYVSEDDDVSQFTPISEEEMTAFHQRVQNGYEFDYVSLEITKEKSEFFDFSYVSPQFESLEIPDFIAFATDGKVATSQSAYESNTPDNYALYQYDGTFLSAQTAYVAHLTDLGFVPVVDGNDGFYCLTQEIDGTFVQIETYYAPYTSVLTVKISLSTSRMP